MNQIEIWFGIINRKLLKRKSYLSIEELEASILRFIEQYNLTAHPFKWTYDRIKDAYGASRTTIAGIARRFVMEGMEAALGRKVQENRRRKVTGDVEARICAIACSEPPEGASRWTMQAIADELIRLEVVDYITDTTVCEVMKKMKSSRGL